MRFLTPFKKAHGLGGVRTGPHHWWLQRLTAIALIPLTVWVAFVVAGLVGKDYATVTAWFDQPFHAVMLVLFVFFVVYHASLGLQVVIEDYVHTPALRIASLIAIKLALIMAGTFCAVVILKLFFAG